LKNLLLCSEVVVPPTFSTIKTGVQLPYNSGFMGFAKVSDM